MNHDDGNLIKEIKKSDIILLGVSRTSKTPTAIYLANKGLKTSNIPLITENSIPEILKQNPKTSCVVGLNTEPERLVEIADDFLKFIKDKRLIIHNAEFDLSHLNNELKIIGKNKIDNEVVDTLSLARNKFPGSQISLDALCKRYRIDNSKRVQHTALIDCDLLSKVYVNLIDQKEPTLDFKNKEEDDSKLNSGKVVYCTKVIKPSPEELKNHQIYLKTFLKKNFY